MADRNGGEEVTELKNCPFCGEIAHFREISNAFQNNFRTVKFQVECAKCHVSIPKLYELEIFFNENGEIKMPKDEREKAIEEWNSRV